MTKTIDDLAAVILSPGQPAQSKHSFLATFNMAISIETEFAETIEIGRLRKLATPAEERAWAVRERALWTISEVIKARPKVADASLVEFVTTVARTDDRPTVRKAAERTRDVILETRPDLGTKAEPQPAVPARRTSRHLRAAGRSP